MFTNAGLVVFILKDKLDEFYTKTYWRHSKKGTVGLKIYGYNCKIYLHEWESVYKSKTIKVESLRLALLL